MKLPSNYFPITLFLLAFLFHPKLSTAQTIPGQDFCTEVSPSSPLPGSLTSCFDEEDVYDECEIVYLRMNFHFFMNDGCGNDVWPHTTTTAQAFAMAENLLDDANAVLANNQDQINSAYWSTPFQSAHCIPIRYVLSGVYFHCNTAAQDDGLDPSGLLGSWGVHTGSELNVFVTELIGGATGIAPINGNVIAIDWFNKGNFNHEAGHMLDLYHSWTNSDGLSDTPPINFSWDRNCDGDAVDPGETVRQCWELITPSSSLSIADANGNMVNDCVEVPPCTPSPCCQPEYQNNNVMSYGAEKDAYTALQIKKMLASINGSHCNYVEAVGGCAPPMAFIAEVPGEWTGKNCFYCLS